MLYACGAASGFKIGCSLPPREVASFGRGNGVVLTITLDVHNAPVHWSGRESV